jgi:chromate transporter
MSVPPSFRTHWKEIARSMLVLGATSYGGPAMMGVMQAELQDKRGWLTKERFVEGLSLVSLLPGATATMLGIFLSYTRGGWWGGLVGGLCFVVPAFVVMLALAVGYAALGVTPVLRGALYGLGPVVLGVFFVAVYRLSRTTCASVPQALIAIATAAAMLWSPLGVTAILVLAGAVGVTVFHSRRIGAAVLAVAAVGIGAFWLLGAPASGASTVTPAASGPPTLTRLAAFFFQVGALTFGGGLTMIAFIQQHVVDHMRWLTPQEFIDGLALGQFTPGPVLMVAAYVGYKIAGVTGAAVSAGAAFLPSFVLMLALLPVIERVRRLTWVRAVLRGIGPAVIGMLVVSLFRLAPYAVPDVFAAAVCAATVGALLAGKVSVVPVMLGGALAGIARTRWWTLAGARGGSLS